MDYKRFTISLDTTQMFNYNKKPTTQHNINAKEPQSQQTRHLEKQISNIFPNQTNRTPQNNLPPGISSCRDPSTIKLYKTLKTIQHT